MKRVGLHFPRLLKAALWLLLLGSWGTGTAWFILHRWFLVKGEFGDEHSAWEPVLIRIHAACAMLIMIYFGYLLATHITVGWRARRNRFFGLLLVAIIGFQIVTAYGLYYVGGEDFRPLISWAHLCAGFSLPFLLAIHIMLGHRTAKTMKVTRPVLKL